MFLKRPGGRKVVSGVDPFKICLFGDVSTSCDLFWFTYGRLVCFYFFSPFSLLPSFSFFPPRRVNGTWWTCASSRAMTCILLHRVQTRNVLFIHTHTCSRALPWSLSFFACFFVSSPVFLFYPLLFVLLFRFHSSVGFLRVRSTLSLKASLHLLSGVASASARTPLSRFLIWGFHVTRANIWSVYSHEPPRICLGSVTPTEKHDELKHVHPRLLVDLS